MIRVAICDDEEVFIKKLRECLNKYIEETGKEISIVEFKDGNELLKNYKMDLDLIFLDIKMEKLDGLKTAEEIRKIDSTVGIIFLTSLPQYVWKGYEYGAVNYLLKPIKYGRLKMELDRFFKMYKGKEEPYITFSNDSGKYKVLYKDIKYVETYNRNVMIHFENQEQIVYMNMKKIAELLEKEPQFCRSHASYIINLAFVKSIEGLDAILTTGEKIPISQPKRKEFMEKMTNYWGDML